MILFGTGKLVCVPTNLADGTAIANPTPVGLAALQDISVDLSVESKPLYGSGRFPIAVGQGKGKIQIKAKNADVDGSVLGSLFYGKDALAKINGAVIDEAASVPASSPYTKTIVPPNSGTFVMDLGVLDASTGKPFKRVGSGVAAGQYMVSNVGVYTFASADAGKAIIISYEYTATSSTGQVFNITNDVMGYTPSFMMLLQEAYDGKNLVLKLNRCVSSKFNLPLKNDEFAVSDFEAEAFADAAGNVGYISLF